MEVDEAIRTRFCPTCRALPAEPCRDEQGKDLLQFAHTERMQPDDVVEATNALRERLDSYGENFSIEFRPIDGGVKACEQNTYCIEQAMLQCIVKFERLINGAPGRVVLAFVAPTGLGPVYLADLVLMAVTEYLKNTGAGPGAGAGAGWPCEGDSFIAKRSSSGESGGRS